MFVKAYRYRCRGEALGRIRDVQRRAGEVYARYTSLPTVYLQSATDPCVWLELHHFADEADYRRTLETLNALPEINRLWDEFQRMLDSQYPAEIDDYLQRAMTIERPNVAPIIPAAPSPAAPSPAATVRPASTAPVVTPAQQTITLTPPPPAASQPAPPTNGHIARLPAPIYDPDPEA